MKMLFREYRWLISAGLLGLLLPSSGQAGISGVCSDCHTMHNSQSGQLMADFAGESGPNAALTRGSCLGCHARGTNQRIVTVGSSAMPQVSHTDGSDLAGGNFRYLALGDDRGHNVVDLGRSDGTLFAPPGGGSIMFHNIPNQHVSSENLTCAGDNGCHGVRIGERNRGTSAVSGMKGLAGAHHGNQDGLLTTADTVANSYRFLFKVKGLENPDPANRWQNASSTSHNEYFGAAQPASLNCNNGGCHAAPDLRVKSVNNTISGFCATCHEDFHTLTVINDGNIVRHGIGTGASPFLRHPSDVALPNDAAKEYRHYTTYNVEAPVARQVLPLVPSNVVTPGSDVVMCLSCHMAHASQYPAMLRWDYSRMVAGNAGEAAGAGCFVCHTTKDD